MAVAALVDISTKFTLGIERGTDYSRAGFVVATDYIYNIEQYIAGEVHARDVKEMVEPVAKRVGKLLENAKEMHTFFRSVQTDVDNVSRILYVCFVELALTHLSFDLQLELNLNNDDAYISNYIATVEAELEQARDSRDAEGAFAIVLGVLTPFVPIVAPLAIGLGHTALEADEIVQDSSLFFVKLLKTTHISLQANTSEISFNIP